MKMWRWRRLKLLQIWNHLLLEMFKFHILDLLLGFFFVKTLFILLMLLIDCWDFIYICVEFNLIVLHFYWNWNFFKTRPADRSVWTAGPRDRDGPIYLVRVRMRNRLTRSTVNTSLCGWVLRRTDWPAYSPLVLLKKDIGGVLGQVPTLMYGMNRG